MEPIDPRSRLEALARAGGHDFASLSRLIGRNEAYIQQFVRRGTPRRLAEPDRRALAAFFGVADAELGGAAGVMPAEQGMLPPDDVVLVPRLDVGAAAGAGAFTDAERSRGRMPFAAAWVRGTARGGARALSVIRVAGDSMLPTLADGDEILVDRADAGGELRDGIYVLRFADALVVKRLAIGPSRRLAVRSDNPAFPSWEDVAREDVEVVGRVLWFGRRL